MVLLALLQIKSMTFLQLDPDFALHLSKTERGKSLASPQQSPLWITGPKFIISLHWLMKPFDIKEQIFNHWRRFVDAFGTLSSSFGVLQSMMQQKPDGGDGFWDDGMGLLFGDGLWSLWFCTIYYRQDLAGESFNQRTRMECCRGIIFQIRNETL